MYTGTYITYGMRYGIYYMFITTSCTYSTSVGTHYPEIYNRTFETVPTGMRVYFRNKNRVYGTTQPEHR